MKNEELLSLRGGYGTACCYCYTWEGVFKGVIANTDALHCNSDCLIYILEHGYGYWQC
jgi:hypothetical protein